MSDTSSCRPNKEPLSFNGHCAEPPSLHPPGTWPLWRFCHNYRLSAVLAVLFTMAASKQYAEMKAQGLTPEETLAKLIEMFQKEAEERTSATDSEMLAVTDSSPVSYGPAGSRMPGERASGDACSAPQMGISPQKQRLESECMALSQRLHSVESAANYAIAVQTESISMLENNVQGYVTQLTSNALSLIHI